MESTIPPRGCLGACKIAAGRSAWSRSKLGSTPFTILSQRMVRLPARPATMDDRGFAGVDFARSRRDNGADCAETTAPRLAGEDRGVHDHRHARRTHRWSHRHHPPRLLDSRDSLAGDLRRRRRDGRAYDRRFWAIRSRGCAATPENFFVKCSVSLIPNRNEPRTSVRAASQMQLTLRARGKTSTEKLVTTLSP